MASEQQWQTASEAKLTCRVSKVIEDDISDGVDDGREGSNTSNVPVEEIESGKLPPSRPDEDVIPPTEHPEPWEICVGNDPRAVGNVAPDLFWDVGPTMSQPLDGVSPRLADGGNAYYRFPVKPR